VKNKINPTCIGNCRDEDLINIIFGSVSEFARQVELNGDEFVHGQYTIKYNELEDIHYFYSLIK